MAPVITAYWQTVNCYLFGLQAKPAAVDMFDCDGVTTTVTTIALHSDDDL